MSNPRRDAGAPFREPSAAATSPWARVLRGAVTMWRFAWLLCCVLALPVPLPAAAEPEAERVLRIGVLAYRDQWATLGRWRPTAEYLSEHIDGHRFQLLTFDHAGLRDAVARGELDFVLTNSGQFVELQASHGLEPLVTMVNAYHGHALTQFGGVIFVRADRAEIQTYDDLRNRTFAAAGAEAFGGFEMAWLELRRHDVDPFQAFAALHWTGLPQDQVVLLVRDGLVDAGTVRTGVLERMAEQGLVSLDEFRVLGRRSSAEFPLQHSTRLYPEWPFARAAHVPAALGRSVAAALLALPADGAVARRAHIAGWAVPTSYASTRALLESFSAAREPNDIAAVLYNIGRPFLGLVASLSLLVLLALAWTAHRAQRRRS